MPAQSLLWYGRIGKSVRSDNVPSGKSRIARGFHPKRKVAGR